MVVERCNERITVADYDKYVTKLKAEMDELDRKLVEFTNNDKSFVVTAEHLLRLASRAKELFESSQPQQKNKILRLLLANLTMNQKRLQLYLLKPFSGLLIDPKSQNWLTTIEEVISVIKREIWAETPNIDTETYFMMYSFLKLSLSGNNLPNVSMSSFEISALLYISS